MKKATSLKLLGDFEKEALLLLSRQHTNLTGMKLLAMKSIFLQMLCFNMWSEGTIFRFYVYSELQKL